MWNKEIRQNVYNSLTVNSKQFSLASGGGEIGVNFMPYTLWHLVRFRRFLFDPENKSEGVPRFNTPGKVNDNYIQRKIQLS